MMLMLMMIIIIIITTTPTTIISITFVCSLPTFKITETLVNKSPIIRHVYYCGHHEVMIRVVNALAVCDNP